MGSTAAFDVVVVGAGHAGCEAAAAAARMGASVAVVTLDRKMVAEMPCNPAVGGIGKGHLVAEIDALGGAQGWLTDRSGIQFRVLNRSRGPAVWGPRAQCDKQRYSVIAGRLLRGLQNLVVVDGEVEAVLVERDHVRGVRLVGGEVLAGATVVVTTGTFLGGVLHTGDQRSAGGRYGERPSEGLGRNLEELGITLRRFKTGTPPRLHSASVDYSELEEQVGDPRPRPFSWRTREVHNRCSCWVGRTSEQVQEIIRANIHRSPLFTGAIEGVGPRYCPSIEDKVVRFPHHREHTIFLEPEGLDTDSVYVNGLSTSLPQDVQERVVRAVAGLGGARFLRYGYAVEYDVIAPGQVGHDLMSRDVNGLFFAGQVLGTSGYEEAAALGLVAGVNATRMLRHEDRFVPVRESSYMGVMIDDLVRKEHREPYRIFTSRAEHRLLLGVDTARVRLMEIGVSLGLVSKRAFHVEQERWHRRNRVVEQLSNQALNPDRETRARIDGMVGIELNAPTTWAKLLTRQDVDRDRASQQIPILAELAIEDREIVLGELRYDGYRERAERERDRVLRLRDVLIPEALDPRGIPGLSLEVVEEMERVRPRTLADAERLPGMTPAAIAILAGRIAAQADRRPKHG